MTYRVTPTKQDIDEEMTQINLANIKLTFVGTQIQICILVDSGFRLYFAQYPTVGHPGLARKKILRLKKE